MAALDGYAAAIEVPTVRHLPHLQCPERPLDVRHPQEWGQSETFTPPLFERLQG